VCDPTIRQPGFNILRQQWSLQNRFRKEQGHCSVWRGNGDLQTLICVLVATPRQCLTLSNPVFWQNWMVVYLGRATLCGWRHCFMTDQLWVMTRIRKELVSALVSMLLTIAVIRHENTVYNKSTHESANLHQLQNFNQKWSGIPIRIIGLIWIPMSLGSVPKWCCGCIILSKSVASPNMVQIGRWLYEKCLQMSRNLLFRNGEENEKVMHNPHVDPDHHQKLITSRGSPLPMPAKFGQRLFPHSLVITIYLPRWWR